jgi:hypothetical protein
VHLTSCRAQTLARSQQLWVLYSTCVKGPLFASKGHEGKLYSERDYLARPWCVYELAMYVKTRKPEGWQKAEIEIISLDGNNSLGAQLSTFVKMIALLLFVYFFHLFSLGVVTNDNVGCEQTLEMGVRCPLDDSGEESMSLSDWKAAKKKNVHADGDPFVWMGQGTQPGTLMWTAGVFWPITFCFVFVACKMEWSLRNERLAICERLKYFSWEDVKDGTDKRARAEVQERIRDSFDSIEEFEKQMKNGVKTEFKKSLLKREKRTMAMLAVFWFFSFLLATQISLYSVDAWRPVFFSEQIATLGEDNAGLWLTILALTYPCMCCFGCCALIRIFSAGGLRALTKGTSVAPA